MEPFTPNTQVVRRIYVFDQANEAKALGGYTESTAKEVGEEFDRMIAKVRAEAWDEGHKARQQEEQSEFEQIAYGSEREPFPEVLKISNPYRQ